MKWIVLALALFQGGWLTFDGGRALIAGDYVTPTSGPRAGQLGPWSRIVSAVGLEPRSTFIKCLHLFLGIAWLIGLVAFAMRPASGWWVVLCCGVATLWYLPIGTFVSIIVLVLLLTPQLRSLSWKRLRRTRSLERTAAPFRSSRVAGCGDASITGIITAGRLSLSSVVGHGKTRYEQ